MDQYTPMNQGNVLNQMPQKKPSGMGAFIGAIIIIILLAVGGLYFWGAKLNQTSTNPPPLILGNDTSGAEQVATSDVAAGLPPQQTSDDPAAISADLNAMNLNQLDAQTASSANAFGASVGQ